MARQGGCCGDFTSACYPALDIRCGTKTCNAAFVHPLSAPSSPSFPTSLCCVCVCAVLRSVMRSAVCEGRCARQSVFL
eukprot:1679858-Rhodomonas_salina.1